METFVRKRVGCVRHLLTSKVACGLVLCAATEFIITVLVLAGWRQSKESSDQEPVGALYSILEAQEGPIAFHPDSKKLVLATRYEVRNLRESKILYQVPYHGKGGGVGYVFSPNGKLVAAAATLERKKSGDPALELRLRDADTGQNLLLLSKPPKQIMGFAFSPDSKYLAETCGSDILIWDISAGKEIRRLHNEDCGVDSIAYHPDGKLLISNSGSDLHFWNVESGQHIHTLSPPESHSFHNPVISPDGKLLAAADSRSEDVYAYHIKSSIRLWELPSRKEIAVLPEQTGPLRELAFHRNNRWLASIGREHSVKIWDVSKRKMLRALPLGADGSYVAFSPDGRWLASAEDRQVKLWDLAPDRQ